jgi:hypothetical protein
MVEMMHWIDGSLSTSIKCLGMTRQPWNILERVAALDYLDAESFLQLAFAVIVSAWVHARPTSGK